MTRHNPCLILVALLLPACSLAPQPTGSAEVAAEQPASVEAMPAAAETSQTEQPAGATPIQRAITLLDAGNEPEAKALLEAVLKENPSNKTALTMMRQIETDPVALLGEAHHTYTVKAGDTLSALAAQHLGDPLLFHALSKYNDLASAQSLDVGTVLKIPGASSSGEVELAGAKATGAATLAALSPADAEKSRDLRRRGLQALNAGQSDLAVQLLAAAYAIDGENKNLESDLKRARSIQQAVTR